MFEKWRLSLVSLLFVPLFGCSTTSDFAEELQGEWYAEGSCDLVTISAQETTGKMWHLSSETGSSGKDKSKDGPKANEEIGDMMAKVKASADAAAKQAKAAVEKNAKKMGPTAGKKSVGPKSAAKKTGPISAKKETDDAGAEQTEEDKVRSKISTIQSRIAELEAEQPRWTQQEFALKLDAAQKEINVVGETKTIQLDGIFVNGEGCKGTATLSGENLVFAFQKNAALDGTATPAQSLCSNSYTLVAKKPDTCATPLEVNSAEVKKLNANLKTNTEALRKLRNTPGSRAVADSYPHACNDLDPKLHTKIAGMKGQCAPRHILRLAQAGWLVEDFTGAPSRFYDSNEMSHLLGPKKENGEKTKLTEKERKKNASRIKSKVFLDESGPKQCKASYGNGSLKVNCDMPIRDIYTAGAAGFEREQKCETKSYDPGRCSKPCERDRDCNRLLCGCETSRCNVFGQCTPCPTEYIKDCEDPKFTVTGVKDWVLTKKISSKSKAAAEALEKSMYQSDAYFLFKMESAFRKIYQHEKYGDMEVEKDSGYIIKAKPLLLAYENEHGPLIMHTAAFTAYHRADGKRYKVQCSEKGLCEIEKK